MANRIKVTCPHCGALRGVRNAGRKLCNNCGRPYDVDENFVARQGGTMADWTLRKTWLVLTFGPATIVGLCYADSHPAEEAWVMFASNVIGWGLVGGLALLLWKQLK
jgi:hypothetical protein